MHQCMLGANWSKKQFCTDGPGSSDEPQSRTQKQQHALAAMAADNISSVRKSFAGKSRKVMSRL